MKYIFWAGAVLMVIFRNELMISDDAGYVSMVMCLLVGCHVFDDRKV